MKHIFQPDGISCGPTCLKMASEFVNKTIDNIGSICKTCGTDNVVGTPPDKMIIGLDKYGFSYKIHVNDSEPYGSLKNVLDNNSIGILRTITKGVPHWIVVYSYDNDIYNVYDPWLGQIKYSEEELNRIWAVRNHFFFEINGKI